MIIKDIHIEQFGFYRDTHFENLTTGINIFTGKNEAGKTSLMQFIRWIFFGDKIWSRGENKYELLSGGQKSGRIMLVTHGGDELLIERHAKKCSCFLNGSSMPEETVLRHYFKHLNPSIYRQVFALTLDDLQGIQFLNDGNADEFFTIAGAGPGAKEAMRLLKKNRAAMDKLLKPSGTRPELNQVLTLLKETGKKLREIQIDHEAYFAKRQEMETTANQLELLDKDEKKVQDRLNHFQLLEKIIPLVVQLEAKTEQLKPLEKAAGYEPGTLEFYRTFKQDTVAKNKQIDDIKGEVKSLQALLGQLSVDKKRWALREEIRPLEHEVTRIRQVIQEQEELRGRKELLEQAVEKAVSELGYGLTGEQVKNMPNDLQISKTIQSFATQIRNLDSELAACAHKKDELTSMQHKLLKQKKRFEQDIEELKEKSRIHNHVEFETIASQTEKYRSLHNELQRNAAEMEYLEEAIANKEKELGRFRNLGRRVHILGAGAVGVPAIIWLVLHVLKLIPTPGVVGWPFFMTIGVLLGLLWMVGVRFVSHSIRLMTSELNVLREKSVEKQEAINRNHKLSKEILSLLGLDREPVGDPEQITRTLLEEMNTFRERKAVQKQLETIIDELEAVQHELEGEDNRKLQLNRRKRELNAEWGTWLEQNGFPPELQSDEMDTFLRAVTPIQNNICEMSHVKDQIKKKQSVINDFSKRANSLLKRLKIDEETDLDNLLQSVQHLLLKLNEDAAKNEKMQETGFRLEALEQQLTKLVGELDELDKKAQKTLQKYNCKTDADLFALKERYEQYQDIHNEVEKLETELKMLVRSESEFKQLRAELESLPAEEPQKSITELSQQLDKMQVQKSELLQGLGRLQKEVELIEKSDAISRLLLEQSTLENRRDVLIREYLSHYFSSYLIQEARKKYEQERQPALYRKANEILTDMTQSGYRLLVDLEDNHLILETGDKKRLPASYWSSGMADQVYLALRLAMIDHYFEANAQVPVLLDDVLVRFDPERSQNTARYLINWAQRRQILFFSCHPFYVEQLNRMANQGERRLPLWELGK